MFFWTWFGMVGVGVWQVRQSKPRKVSDVPWHESQSTACGPVATGKKREVCSSRVGCVSQRAFPVGAGEQPTSTVIASRTWTGRCISAWTSPSLAYPFGYLHVGAVLMLWHAAQLTRVQSTPQVFVVVFMVSWHLKQ